MPIFEADAIHTSTTADGITDNRPAPPTPSDRPKPQVQWKLVVASDEEWRGEIYPTRAGRHRQTFNNPVEFLEAVRRLTEWKLPW